MDIGTISALISLSTFGWKCVKVTPSIYSNIKNVLTEQDFSINKPFIKAFNEATSFMIAQYPYAEFKESLKIVNKYQDDRIISIFGLPNDLEIDNSFRLDIFVKVKFNEYLKLNFDLELNDDDLNEWFKIFNQNYNKKFISFILKNENKYKEFLLKGICQTNEKVDEVISNIKITANSLERIGIDLNAGIVSIHTDIEKTKEDILENQAKGFSSIENKMEQLFTKFKDTDLSSIKFDDDEQQKIVDYLKELITQCRFVEAISTFKKLFDKIENSCSNEKLAKIYNNYGVCYSSIGDLENANKSFLKALDYNNNSDDAKYNLFVIYINNRELEKAKKYLEQINPENKKFYEAKYAIMLAENQYDDTEKFLDDNIDKFDEYKFNKAKLYFQKQEDIKAQKYLEEYLEEKPNDYTATAFLVNATYNANFGKAMLVNYLSYSQEKFEVKGTVLSEKQQEVIKKLKRQVLALLDRKESKNNQYKGLTLSNQVILANMYIIEQEFGLAQDIINEIEQNTDASLEVTSLKSRLNFSFNKFKESLSYFEVLKDNFPEHFDNGQYKLALFGANNLDTYISETNNLNEIDDNMFAFRIIALTKLNKKEQAEKEAYEFYDKDTKVSRKFILANLLNLINKKNEAKKYFDELINELVDDKNNWFNYYLMGIFYLKANSLEKAEECFEISWAQNKTFDNISSAEELSLIFFNKKDFANALKICQEINQIDPNNITAKKLLLNIDFFFFNNYHQIIENYENNLYFGLNFHNFHMIIGESYLNLKEYQKTIRYAQNISQLNSIYSYSLLVKSYSALEEYDKAENKLNELIEKNPYDSNARKVFLNLYFEFLLNRIDEKNVKPKTGENVRKTFQMLTNSDWFDNNAPLKQGKIDTSNAEKTKEDFINLIKEYENYDERLEFISTVENTYNTGMLPLITAATLRSQDRPLEYMLEKIYSKYYNIYTHSLRFEIQNKEQEIIFKIKESGEKLSLIVDIHSLLILIELNLYNYLAEVLDIKITPFTYNLLASAIKTYDRKDYKYLRINKDWSFYLEEKPPEYIQKFLDFFKQNLDFFEKNIEEVNIEKLDINLFQFLSVFKIREDFTNHIQEGLLAKQKDWFTCCSDDILSQTYFDNEVNAISLQSILNLLFVMKKIDVDTYVHKLVILCKLNYKYISINSNLLALSLLNKQEIREIESFKSLLDTLNNENLDIKITGKILAELIRILNKANMPEISVVLDVIFDKITMISIDGTLLKELLKSLDRSFFELDNELIRFLNERFLHAFDQIAGGRDFYKSFFIENIEYLYKEKRDTILILENKKVKRIYYSTPENFKDEVKKYAEQRGFAILL